MIEDIRPCAHHHFLVITKSHIRDCNALTHSDLDLCIFLLVHQILVNEMESLGRRILKEQNATGKVMYHTVWNCE